MRLFAALLPPEEALDDLEEFLAPRREAADFRWSPQELWHLTLAFADPVPERVLEDLLDRLARAAGRRRPISLRVAGGGAFPHAGRARLLYAGLASSAEDRTELDRLATGARAAFGKAGAPADGSRFRPHLTVARMGRPVEATRWVRLLDAYAGPTWTAGEVALVRSYLGVGPRNRPRYEVVGTFPLGRDRSGSG